MMEREQDSAPAHTPPQPKRADQALYVPKQRLQGTKDKGQTQTQTPTQTQVKPKPRPRYTDKARKNAKNKKDRVGAAETTAAAGAGHEDEMQLVVNGQPEETEGQTDAASPEGEEDSWDTLFNDDGDYLDPHLLEEVRTTFCTSN